MQKKTPLATYLTGKRNIFIVSILYAMETKKSIENNKYNTRKGVYFFCFFSNTNCMIWWAIALYLVILILIFPIKLQAKLNYGLFENKGSIGLFLWGIKVFERDCMIDGLAIKLQKGNKNSKIYLNNFGKNDFGDRFVFSFLKMIKVNTVKSDILVGLKDDSFYTNIIAGALLSVETALLAVVSTKKKIKILRAEVLQTNLESKLNFAFSFSITICILQLLASLIFAAITKQKGVYYGKQSN